MSCIDNCATGPAGSCKKCGFARIWTNGLRKKLVSGGGNLKSGVHPVWLTEMKWSRYKSHKPGPGEKELLLQPRSGSIIDFLDEFEPVSRKYAYHRYILHRTRESNTQFERSAMPGMLKVDIDWAENLSLPNAFSIQSEYWLTHSASLFICIAKVLLLSSWSATTGQLKIATRDGKPGAEVTVELEGEPAFWATVISGGGKEESSDYIVEDEHQLRRKVQRRYLRARVWKTVASVGVTGALLCSLYPYPYMLLRVGAGDKKHDSYATQYFTLKMLRWWIDGSEVIHSIHIHSDNAGTHFKSNKTLNFLSRLKALLGVPVSWSFGCLGHGMFMHHQLARMYPCVSLCVYHCVCITVCVPLCVPHAVCLTPCVHHCVCTIVCAPLCVYHCVCTTVCVPLCASHCVCTTLCVLLCVITC